MPVVGFEKHAILTSPLLNALDTCRVETQSYAHQISDHGARRHHELQLELEGGSWVVVAVVLGSSPFLPLRLLICRVNVNVHGFVDGRSCKSKKSVPGQKCWTASTKNELIPHPVLQILIPNEIETSNLDTANKREELNTKDRGADFVHASLSRRIVEHLQFELLSRAQNDTGSVSLETRRQTQPQILTQTCTRTKTYSKRERKDHVRIQLQI